MTKNFEKSPRAGALARILAVASLGVTLTPAPAEAFCGFYVSGADSDLYNNATQVALMRSGTRTVLSMQNNYKGPPESFAMVIPVPVVLQEDNVKTLDKAIFKRLDQLAAPRLVEYWEQDPCRPMRPPGVRMSAGIPDGAVQESAGGGGGLGVTVEAQFTVGEYEIVILSAKDSTGLDTWLRQQKYQIPQGAEPLLRPYVEGGSKFFVAKVDSSKVTFKDGMAMLSPLRFYYDSEQFSLPIRLGMINSEGTQDLIVHILAPGQRYEVANYKNAFIPTNVLVKNEVRERFGEFYAALFDATLEKNPGAVVTEYSWDASTCDPCPTPALVGAELATLGADVLTAKAGKAGASSKGIAPGPIPAPRGFVLTRLHARYGKGDLAEDLVFKAGEPVAGGRGTPDTKGQLRQGTENVGMNMFQGRYAILHEWQGEIACEKPRRGHWGGPPAGEKGTTDPKPALDLAFAPRGKVKLASLVAQTVPGLDLGTAGEGVSTKPGEGGKQGAAGAGKDGDKKEGAKKESSKKGCQTGGDGSGALGWIFLALASLVAVRRRRRGE